MTQQTFRMTYCPICNAPRPRCVVERFHGGAFAACLGCGVHFAETAGTDLQAYYRDIWSDDNLGCDPYAEKVAAAQDPARLERLLTTVPRFRWAVRQLQGLPRGAR